MSSLPTLLTLVTLVTRAVTQRPPRRGCEVDGISMCGYESHEQMVARLMALQQSFPGLARVDSIGRSVRGRHLVTVKLSANVESRSLMEPMFKYVGNMHGNEVVGRQLLIYLAEFLARGYGRDQRITRLLNTTEIYLLPSLNPDGYAASRPGECDNNRLGRQNANGVDLNRNFPRQFDEPQHDFRQLLRGREPETAAAMVWVKRNPFVLSANLHAGAVVASYPFDDSPSHQHGFYSAAPDDAVFQLVAREYSSKHRTMWTNVNCKGDNFPGGITNGAQWYDVPGGMQDFNYVHSNAFEITLELTCCKHPAPASLPAHWGDNREALLSFIEKVHIGVKGVVTDTNGAPVAGATVKVDGLPHDVVTTDRGEYWRLLVPGRYTLSAVKAGLGRSRPVGVAVAEHRGGGAQVVNLVLDSSGDRF